MTEEKTTVAGSVLYEGPVDYYQRLLKESSATLEWIGVDLDDNAMFAWTKATIEEPVTVALDALASRGVWVGTEAELYEKIERLTSPGGKSSGPFPSDPEALTQHLRDLKEYSITLEAAGLEVLDHRELAAGEAAQYEAPRWGSSKPILLAKDGAASKNKPLFYTTLFRLARHEKPLLLAALKSTRKQQRWSGTTSELRERLIKYYPDATPMGFVYAMGTWKQVPDRGPGGPFYSRDYLYEHGEKDYYYWLDREIDMWLGPENDPSDHPEHPIKHDLLKLYELMSGYSPILKPYGVKVTRSKPPGGRTTWTIEGPSWHFEDYDKIFQRLWYLQRSRVIDSGNPFALSSMSLGIGEPPPGGIAVP